MDGSDLMALASRLRRSCLRRRRGHRIISRLYHRFVDLSHRCVDANTGLRGTVDAARRRLSAFDALMFAEFEALDDYRDECGPADAAALLEQLLVLRAAWVSLNRSFLPDPPA